MLCLLIDACCFFCTITSINHFENDKKWQFLIRFNGVLCADAIYQFLSYHHKDFLTLLLSYLSFNTTRITFLVFCSSNAAECEVDQWISHLLRQYHCTGWWSFFLQHCESSFLKKNLECVDVQYLSDRHRRRFCWTHRLP